MQVRCPHCSTAYEIPPPVRPRRLRCAECGNEWRELPLEAQAKAHPDAGAASADPPPRSEETPVADTAIAPAATPATASIDLSAVPGPVIADALQPGLMARRTPNGLVLWLVLWALSLLLIAGAMFASWHFRVAIEHRLPESLWLFRLLPAGVPV